MIQPSGILAALLLMSTAAAAQQETPTVGWRGDGSGKYPSADPPTAWGRVSKSTQGLRFKAGRPAAEDRGEPMPDGVVREWLILTPPPAGARVDQELFPDEPGSIPEEGGKVGESVWKKTAVDTSWVDFRKILGPDVRGLGCAAANVYSETGGKFRLSATQLGAFRVVLNGKPLPVGYGRYSIDLAKGWNRVLLKCVPHESGWAFTFTLHSRAPAEYAESAIAWRVPLPGVTFGFYGGGTGCSAPLVVGNRIYVLSEPHDLICLDKEDGRVLWVRTSSYFDAAGEEERKDPEASALAKKLDDLNALLPSRALDPKQLEEKMKLESALYARMKAIDPVRYKRSETPDVGFSGMTPVTDGKHLYAWFATGVTVCYDLEGRRKWIRVDNRPGVEHGFSSSPVLVDGKVIVFMRDVLAFDAATGNPAWRIPLISHEGFNPGGYFHGTPTSAVVGGVPLVVLGNGTVVRAADGKILRTHPEMGNQAISSPVVDRGLLFETTTGSMKFFIQSLPAAADEPFKLGTRIVSVATPAFPHYYMPWHMSSPLVHDGLAYLLNNAGVLTVVDVAEAKVVYQKMLDLDGFQTSNEGPARGLGISPALAGKYLYLTGNAGATLVLEPGRVYKQVAKNKIESLVSVGHWGERQERFVSNPVFDGDRLYLRGEGHLYAIGGTRGAAVRKDADARPVDPAPVKKAPAFVAEPLLPDEPASPRFGFRRNGSGTYPGTTPPLAWSDQKNIRWRVPVGQAHSSPIVTGDRVLVLSEPGELVCLSRTDGKRLWGSTILDPAPGKKLPKEIARATPVTDGSTVVVSLAAGTVAALNLEGKRLWTQQVEPPSLAYGPGASPVLAGDLVLVEGKALTALELATGRVRWSAATEAHYGTPAVLTLEGIALAVTAKGTVVRISDGAILATGIAEELGGDQSPTPVVRGDVVYFAYHLCSAVKLAFKEGRLITTKLWEQELPGSIIASPVLAGGMLFVVPSGSAEYRVLHARTGEVLLEKDLELGANLYPSLALAGGKLYLGNDKGEQIVLEPGPVYKELQRNRLPEGSGASPVFAGSHLFLRGGDQLYCIGP